MKNVLIINADNNVGVELTRAFAREGESVFPIGTKSDSLLSDMEYLNPELSYFFHPIFNKLDSKQSYASLANVLQKKGCEKIDVIIHLKDTNESNTSSFDFQLANSMKGMLSSSSLMCYGLSHESFCLSDRDEKSLEVMVDTCEKLLSSDISGLKVIKLVDHEKEFRGSAKEIAEYYIDQIDIAQFQVSRLDSVFDVFYFMIYNFMPRSIMKLYFNNVKFCRRYLGI
ncbi:hypothetical protein CANARDRAFT_21905 [[Candida] arabinofermentans NRRL YB-2248]|uniref:Uncharacterized protein n=1 Tax=[Candida] arabinofermentans NRRL YB-2248 TaxID=983967 RepID=A0A1E4T5A6_9ASCO|nr:hypothetical protein CANARDRAFT_21905 [[Candida] arabinofermentans NRRL YB-2248]